MLRLFFLILLSIATAFPMFGIKDGPKQDSVCDIVQPLMAPQRKTCLIAIDGWGISPVEDPRGDAIRNANTPIMTYLHKEYPSQPLAAHGLAVGLPDGLMGNSEVGHLNIGAGRIVFQDIVRIDLAVQKHQLQNQPAFRTALEDAKKAGVIHFLGLVSDGGVHSHMNHLMEMLIQSKAFGIPTAYIHFIADGRDTSPRSASQYLKQLIDFCAQQNYGTIADIMGRYYAMDRDKRWERIQIAYDAYVQGTGELSSDPLATIQERYAKDETDEFLKPIIVAPEGRLKDRDVLVCFNYRSDRMRQIAQAFTVPPLPFTPTKTVSDLKVTSMTQYKADFPFPAIFPPQSMENVLAEWLSKQNVPQCHVAETEKYAHVTFFFNGGTEAQFAHEDREMVPSPKVATYDLKPEMSAIEVAEAVAKKLDLQKYPFVMCNFAPPDMVGHTGIYEAAIKGVEATDKGIGIIYEACKRNGYTLFVTADHGNAEKMLSDDFSTPHTAHTTAKVPFVMTSKDKNFVDKDDAALCDVAPTILDFMGLPIPAEMTGTSLIK